ncbi:LPS translocon maturation chaperone LptM [Bacillus sp. 7884-1]|uniref:LPS translocon maturation chaperone LptM n=1 Tax=Bacillus sp. 7884-1 TaxID=2021693 RepID=UPI000BA6A178|nr:SCO family protein [Bacillus sp. 7884-1]PAE37026.1 cytochrome c oxidase assembly protein [Bacillus sp. 7884-1]
MKHRLYIFLLIICALLLSACGQKGIQNPLDYPVKDFTAVTQENKAFEKKNLDGKIWVADFIFTNCADVCPPMTANMTKLQKMVEDKKLENVEFVSFSVDPTVDTPEKLTEYAQNFGLKDDNWTFLTGYSQEFIETYARETFKTLVKKPQEGDQVIHQTYFFLVGPDEKVKKIYDGYKEVPYDEMISDIKALQ